jgi:NADPH-dependent 2,4-dienoyl-CoA reductase/sulfur reductase-like enzyme
MRTPRVCVIGAGGAGLAAMRALARRGLPFVGFERGSETGGNWRYANDNEASAAYPSLRCNVSRRRMQFREYPMPASYGDYPHHSAMAAYLDAYADAYGLRRHIRFATPVERVTPTGDRGWHVDLGDGSRERFDAVVVANGHHWSPRWPELPGTPTVTVSHAQRYRGPEPFRGARVVVIGAGQSAVEIATEVSQTAARTVMSIRSGTHVLPRYLFGRPVDELDVDLLNRLPWPVLNAVLGFMVGLGRRGGDASRYGFRRPRHRLLEDVPVISSDLAPALRTGAIVARPAVVAVDGREARFADGAVETVDHVVCATGYEVRWPFLDEPLTLRVANVLPLYRRIVPPTVPGLYFVGLVDAPSGLLPIVERQSAWVADVIAGRLRLPDTATMTAALAAPERRTSERFPNDPQQSIRCDPHAYMRVLARDRRWVRLRAHFAGSFSTASYSSPSDARRARAAAWLRGRSWNASATNTSAGPMSAP